MMMMMMTTIFGASLQSTEFAFSRFWGDKDQSFNGSRGEDEDSIRFFFHFSLFLMFLLAISRRCFVCDVLSCNDIQLLVLLLEKNKNKNTLLTSLEADVERPIVPASSCFCCCLIFEVF
jgi:hypothetical protein